MTSFELESYLPRKETLPKQVPNPSRIQIPPNRRELRFSLLNLDRVRGYLLNESFWVLFLNHLETPFWIILWALFGSFWRLFLEHFGAFKMKKHSKSQLNVLIHSAKQLSMQGIISMLHVTIHSGFRNIQDKLPLWVPKIIKKSQICDSL